MKDKFDVIIIGSGPAGSACALSLAGSGLDIALVDKAIFPRDKVCGDALSADVAAQLPLLSEHLMTAFAADGRKIPSYGVRLYAPDLTCVDIPFRGEGKVTDGHVFPRKDFDDLLLREVKAQGICDVFEGCTVTQVSEVAHGVDVATDKGRLAAQMVVGADGANSVVARLAGNGSVDRRHHSAGLRVYYDNVKGFHEGNHIELYFFRNILPGYLWVFPLPGGRANVGIGLLSSVVSKRKINLRGELKELLATHPCLKDRFAMARPLETGKGHALPLGSRKRHLSGNRFLLAGDAAGLIDPFTGEGIGNAIRSGRVAALHLVQSFRAEDFSAEFNRAYDIEIYRRMGKELRLGYALQRLCKYPWLFNYVIRKASRSRYWHGFLTSALADVSIKMQFTDPAFYYRLLVK